MDDASYEKVASKLDELSMKRMEKAAESLDLDPYRGTDEANAALFLAMHGADVRYCPPWDKWLLWTGSHWRIDDLMDVALPRN